MVWIILLSLFLIAGTGALVWFRVRENRFLKKRTAEAIDPKLNEAWQLETQDAERRKQKFEGELKKFGF